ncbi:MAG: rod shape-determining protein MreC [Capnocytophaga sp.]|nr:rod shape-determining protein MreC [Capnocytophaga sp.]
MQQIIRFFVRKKEFFVFLLLFVISFGMVVENNYYQQSGYVNSTNFLAGGVFDVTNSWAQYIDLKTQNQLLSDENKRLHDENLYLKELIAENAPLQDSIAFGERKFSVKKANVIKNSYSLTKNYLTIDKGKREEIMQDMGVISSKGLVGIVERTSNRFATVQSLLNSKSFINAEIKKSRHYGTLKWDGKNFNIVQLVDIPNIAPIKIGDTIITGGMSNIFPKGIPIGEIQSFERSKTDNSYIINVALFTDMSSIEHVYILYNKDKKEIGTLENLIPDE